MVFGGVEPDSSAGGQAEIYPNVDFLFSDDSGRYPSFRKDIGITGVTLTHSGENYAEDIIWEMDNTNEQGKRRPSVTNNQQFTDGDVPVANSGVPAQLQGLYGTAGWGGGSPAFSGFYTGLSIYYIGENYTGVPTVLPPTNWNITETAGKNPDLRYFDVSGLRQCISGWTAGTGEAHAAAYEGTGVKHGGMGVYTGSTTYKRNDATGPTIYISGGTGINPGDPPVTGTGVALMALYSHPQAGTVWGVTGVNFDSDSPWRGQYKSTGYAYAIDHDDMHDLHHNPSGIPRIWFSGGSFSGQTDADTDHTSVESATGFLTLTQNARASGYVETGENKMLKDQYVGEQANWLTEYQNIGNYPYKDNLNILNLFLELTWSGHSGIPDNP